MIKIENAEVVGWEHAIREMRNPLNSWDKSDSGYCYKLDCLKCLYYQKDMCNRVDDEDYAVGHNDFELMNNLAEAGTDHSKYLRYLEVYADITAPLYWWKEFKTYRKGKKFLDDEEDFFSFDEDELIEDHIEMNSCSTMHKIHSKEFSTDDFSVEHLISSDDGTEMYIGNDKYHALDVMIFTIDTLNHYRRLFLDTKNKRFWLQMIQLLPSSYNQRRTLKMSYQVLRTMYRSRKGHKLDEWREFCKWIEALPYSEIITG